MLPNDNGYFGQYGGRYVPETLMPMLIELEKKYNDLKRDAEFLSELESYLKNYVGRPSPLYFARRLTEYCGGAKIFLKREDLNHTGAHKINNTIGQALIAKRMRKNRIIAETGAGQHGVATATAAALFGFKCVIYMGEEDIKRQSSNVVKMRLLGAKVVPVSAGSKTLKDAMNEAIRDWVTNVESTFYIIGSVAGPHPYPMIVRDFQSVIGREAHHQIFEKIGKLPDYVIACVGGGSNSMGIFNAFLKEDVNLIGVEAAGMGLDSNKHSATLEKGSPGVLHGSKSYVLQDEYGRISPTHSVAAGLDYPGVGPEHSYLKDIERVFYTSVTDDEALKAFKVLSEIEGIIPALESAHAVSYAMKIAKEIGSDKTILVNLSGRGDKDVRRVQEIVGV